MVIESILAVESDFRSKNKKIDMKKSVKITHYHEQVLQAIEGGNFEQGDEMIEILVNEVHKMYRKWFLDASALRKRRHKYSLAHSVRLFCSSIWNEFQLE